DALFQKVRVRAGLQQIRVVVGLEDQQVDVFELACNVLGDPAQIGGDGGAATARLEAKAERLAAVVRHCERLYVKLTEGVGLAGRHGFGEAWVFQLEGAQRAAGGVDGHVVGLRQRARRTTVVAVRMRQHYAREIVQLDPDRLDDGFDLRVRPPALDQQTGALTFDEVAVAVTARGERQALHRMSSPSYPVERLSE